MNDRIGQELGHYRLVRLLGTGGFADVYLAEHRTLSTLAAIKVLNTHLATQEQVDQFYHEAYLIARLIHPHIVRVLDFGVESEMPFLVMDYAPYGTLRQHYPHGTAIPVAQILPYVRQVADALQYAHDHQLIHRDVKPENLLLGRQGEVWLSDFGIAVVAHNTDSLPTQDNAQTVGTLAYMAPEQLRGFPRPASDQYALAIVVYEWLTGERPFSGMPLELVYQQQFVPPAPLRHAGSVISPGVEAVVLKALSKDARERFASVQAFATALEQASEEADFPGMWSTPGSAASPITPRTSQEDLALLPTTLLPGHASSVTAPSQGRNVQEEPGEAPAKKSERFFGESTTLPEDEQASPPTPPSPRSAARSVPHRTRRALLAGGLLLVVLGATLLVLGSGWLSGSFESALAPTSSSTLISNSSPPPGQTSGSTPHVSATGSALPTPVGTSPTGTTTSGTPTPTASATPSLTPGALPPQLVVTPLAVNFTLSLVNCLLQNQPQTLTVKNTGGSGMNWQAVIQNPSYLTLSQSTGHLEAGQTARIGLSFVCQSVVVHANDPITFTSNGGGTVVVTVTITLS